MTTTLNTGHPLYGNLKLLIGVNESNQLVDYVTPTRTFTKHANAVYGTGTLGRFFGTRASGNFTTYGASFSPAFGPANNTGTLVVVTNKVTSAYPTASGFAQFIGNASSTPVNNMLAYIGRGSGSKYVVGCYDTSLLQMSAAGTTDVVANAARMVSLVRNGETAYSFAVNGVEEISGTKLGTNRTSAASPPPAFSFLGGISGQASLDCDIVWIAWFDVALTPTQISDLYASLGANNTFALVTNTVDTTAPTLGGSITVGTVTMNSIQVTWPAGSDDTAVTSYETNLDSAGWVDRGNVLTYTFSSLSPGTSHTIQVRAKDAAGNVSTPALTVTQSTTADTTPPTLGGSITVETVTSTSIAVSWPAGTDNVAVVSYETNLDSAGWVDRGNVLAYTFTGLTASTSHTIQVRAKDAAGNVSTPALTVTQSTLAADTQAPNLSAPIRTATSATTATVGATTDEANGVMYYVVTTSATSPSIAQVQAGQNNTGAAAVKSGSVTVSSIGAKTFAVTGLTPSTTYYAYVQHTDAAGNPSTPVQTGASFTTAASGVLTLPVLKNNTGTVLANEAGATVHVYNTDGTLLVTKTAQTSNGSGIMAVVDALFIAGTTYRVVVVLAGGAEGMDKVVAA